MGHAHEAPSRCAFPTGQPRDLSAFDANRAVMRETRQTRIENRACLDAPVFAAHFTVPAAGYFESAGEARPFVPGEGNLDSKEVR
jgi:hypothetical protein